MVGGIPIASAILLQAEHLDARSAWNQHIPFAFWLVQTHRPAIFVELGTFRGTSYFSFCQAIDALRLPTRCFAAAKAHAVEVEAAWCRGQLTSLPPNTSGRRC
jgi:hypothetical protein